MPPFGLIGAESGVAYIRSSSTYIHRHGSQSQSESRLVRRQSTKLFLRRDQGTVGFLLVAKGRWHGRVVTDVQLLSTIPGLLVSHAYSTVPVYTTILHTRYRCTGIYIRYTWYLIRVPVESYPAIWELQGVTVAVSLSLIIGIITRSWGPTARARLLTVMV